MKVLYRILNAGIDESVRDYLIFEYIIQRQPDVLKIIEIRTRIKDVHFKIFRIYINPNTNA